MESEGLETEEPMIEIPGHTWSPDSQEHQGQNTDGAAQLSGREGWGGVEEGEGEGENKSSLLPTFCSFQALTVRL